MKTFKISFAALLIIFLMPGAFAQPAPPKPGHEKPHPENRLSAGLQVVENFTGTVQEWTSNADFVYDGFILKKADSTFSVHFPPRLGMTVTSVAKKGSTVSLAGVRRISPEAAIEIRLVSIGNDKNLITGMPALPETAVATSTEVINGAVGKFVYNDRGDMTGVMINNSLLKLKPAAKQLATLLQPGTKLSAIAVKKILQKGEVRSNNIEVYDCQTITINGTQYLL